MSDSSENAFRLTKGGVSKYGATFWTLKQDSRFDGKAKGGLQIEVDIRSEKEGLLIAGQLIPWVDLLEAKVHAEAKRTRFDDEA